MTVKRKFSINLGVHGQLTHDTLADAIIGIDYRITTSSSTWGNGNPAPLRYYMTGFVFLDTDKIPLIGPDQTYSVDLSQAELPDKSDEFFGEEIGKGLKITRAWEAKDQRSINSAILFMTYGLGKKFKAVQDVLVGNLRERICQEVGEATAIRNQYRADELAAAANASAPHTASADVKATAKAQAILAGKHHFDARAWDKQIGELERAYDTVGQYRNASLIFVQVDRSKTKTTTNVQSLENA